MKKCVLILCTGNSCRSQMAEGLWHHLGGDNWEAYSAGSRPAGFVHPLAVAAMAELGIDISEQVSKHADQFVGRDLDLVVTVCDGARESCPVIPGAKATLHWPLADPAEAVGSDDERLAVFRRVRDTIRERIGQHLRETPPATAHGA